MPAVGIYDAPMNRASCGPGTLRTVMILTFFILSLVLTLRAQPWDTQGAQHAFQEARQKRSVIGQATQPSKDQYLDCAQTYRKVYVKDPHYGRAGDAIYEEAAIYQEMGDRFADPEYYKTAARRFRMLVKDYGGNQNCPDALERLANIYSKKLNEEPSAREALKLLKDQYPHSTPALHPNSINSIQAPSRTTGTSPPKAEIASIHAVRFLSKNTSTSVTIDMDRQADFQKDRLSGPDRIYLDISNARLSDGMKNRTFAVGDGILKQVRVAQTRLDVVRIVLDCSDAGDYSIAELHNPYGIVIDLRRRSGESSPQSKAKSNSSEPAAQSKAPPDKTSPVAGAASGDQKKPEPPTREAEKKSSLPLTDAAKHVETSASLTVPADAMNKTAKPLPAVVPEVPLPKAAMPTSRGDRTLTRMLGLKVGRIVIDPGHGGHDQGTIGPGGFAEKDLVLSIALKLQEMLQEKLGAEVVLTRKDDTFIPLEERTEIANQHRADLFISIHANSSSIRSISGVETYYLNFAKTDTDREIAARENATTLNNVGELEDLIKKIAQADKSAESRELASTIQKKLFAGARQLLPSTKNRGVRSAPFVVLIGANMPSILAEVAFISNPKDERSLKKEANREYLVKALYSGIEAYINALGSDAILGRQVQKQ
jgi:N-acetylmuramoyl-L-alanine amidase